MRRSRPRFLFGLFWLGLVFLSLRPVEPVRRAVDWAVAPLSFVCELTRPLRVLRRRQVLAVERHLSERAEREAQAHMRILAAMEQGAKPSEPALLVGRRAIPGEVLGRVRGKHDLLRVWVTEAAGIALEMPVAAGNAYVGRVIGAPLADGRPAPPGAALIEVQMVTSREFYVGARASAGAEPVFMTVGGIDSPTRGLQQEVRLAVHNPSDRELSGGLARVYELFREAEPYADLSEGLHLGEVHYDARSARWTITPEVDYLDGLTHVSILLPADAGGDAGGAQHGATAGVPDVLMDTNWVRATPLGLGDPSPWREAIKVRGGAAHGIRVGAAVTAIGARLVGRITRVGPWSSDVSFLGDPGFRVTAVALWGADVEPRVLGRLVSLGRNAIDRSVRLRWKPRVAFSLDARSGQGTTAQAQGGTQRRRVRLFTGSGDPGLPGGFFLGTAEMPAVALSGEEYELRLLADIEPLDVRSLFIRTESRLGP